MRQLRRFGLFWWDFIVGDDWIVAAAVILGLAVTALLARAGVNAWWLLPILAVGLIPISIWRLQRNRS